MQGIHPAAEDLEIVYATSTCLLVANVDTHEQENTTFKYSILIG